MMHRTVFFPAWRGLAALFCLVACTLTAQQRTTGGGGLGGSSYGGGARPSGAGGGASGSTVERPANGQVGTVNSYVDPDSRRLIFIGDEKTAQAVSNAIASLDKPKPQVLIKVVFLQVTYNNGYDVGIEGGVTKKVNSSSHVSISNAFGLAQQGITPTSGINTLPGAGLYSIVGDDFSATIRAIEEVGKVEVLSRPVIMARNNQQATVVVGQQVPIINGIEFDTLGNEHSSIAYQNVGVILQVTPFITSDNLVEMILAPQISSVANQSTLISSGTNGNFSTPYINIESANTVVVTPNGQTVAIGGLMQNTKTMTDSKIPLLGDIPGLGVLFHHKLKSVQKTELIIFLTPYVIRTPDDLVRMTMDEKSRLDIAPGGFSQRELHNYIAPQPAAPVTPTGRPHDR
jgi:general secretion pathway protein D